MAALRLSVLGMIASAARHVVSILSCAEPRYAQPPEGICRERSTSVSNLMQFLFAPRPIG
jgi:hypothetical protein